MANWDGKSLVSIRYLASLLEIRPSELRSLARSAGRSYHSWDRQKRDSSATRRINNPAARLKFVQRRIKCRLLDQIELPPFITGGIPGRSAVNNAAFHVGQAEVIKLDFRDFFPSIDRDAVHRIFQRKFGAGREVARILTELTTLDGVLPQGAPTSSTLAALFTLPFAEEVHALCASRNLKFSIYVDDNTISGVSPRAVLNDIARIASHHHLQLARKKTAFMPAHREQEVTGLLVNGRVSAPRSVRLRARSQVLAVTHGSSSAKERAQARGLLNYVAQVSPERTTWLKRKLGDRWFDQP